MASDIHIRPRSRKDTVATATTVSSHPPPIPPQHQQQQGPHSPSPTNLSSSPWTVTYSTLPMWRNKRNVKIAYSPLSRTPYKGNPNQSKELEEQEETPLSDLVTYQSMTSNRIHSVRGIDKPTPPDSSKSRKPCPLLSFLTSCSRHSKPQTPTPNSWAYTWRGSGYLKPFTSNWEILGYGSVSVERIKHDWLLTYFSETRLTPAGVDICFRRSSPSDDEGGMGEPPEQLISEIRRKLQDSEDEILKRLGGEIFRVKFD